MQRAWTDNIDLIDKVNAAWESSQRKYEEFEAARAEAAKVLDHLSRKMYDAASEQCPDAKIRIAPVTSEAGQLTGMKIFINDTSYNFEKGDNRVDEKPEGREESPAVDNVRAGAADESA